MAIPNYVREILSKTSFSLEEKERVDYYLASQMTEEDAKEVSELLITSMDNLIALAKAKLSLKTPTVH